jgi:hypothetical protein
MGTLSYPRLDEAMGKIDILTQNTLVLGWCAYKKTDADFLVSRFGPWTSTTQQMLRLIAPHHPHQQTGRF